MKCCQCGFWDKYGDPNDSLYGKCTKINEANLYDNQIKKGTAFVLDCMGGEVCHYFYTRYDFGCLLYKGE